MIDRKAVLGWVNKIAEQIPCHTYDEVMHFIKSKPEGKLVAPTPEIRIDDHWFSIRRNNDAVSGDDILEIFIGNRESGDDYMGYDRIDPRWHDADAEPSRSFQLGRVDLDGRCYPTIAVGVADEEVRFP